MDLTWDDIIKRNTKINAFVITLSCELTRFERCCTVEMKTFKANAFGASSVDAISFKETPRSELLKPWMLLLSLAVLLGREMQGRLCQIPGFCNVPKRRCCCHWWWRQTDARTLLLPLHDGACARERNARTWLLLLSLVVVAQDFVLF